MKIKLLQNAMPARFAAEELSRYTFLMMGGMPPVIKDGNKGEKCEPHTISLGLLSDFDLFDGDVEDSFIDDVIDISINNGAGYIAGSNPRSVLMGVYKYLKSAGCMWVRPGVEGESIPKKDISDHSYTYRKKADCPFRGQCSEGALSYEAMRDMLYWMPKVGMNMYMNEGETPYLYMHKWYAHIANTHLREKGFVAQNDVMKQYIDRIELDFQKTGVQYHNMGHGWMFREFGVENGHNHGKYGKINEEDKKYLALTRDHGDPSNPEAVRDIAWNSVFYTNFCYSNPEARKKLVDFWVKYAKEKPYIDYFHVWLGDSRTSGCICEECQKMEFSDWYVMLLNEIDEALTKENIKARFVFIMYVYTHRPPKKLKINNPERFMLLYARGIDYGKGYSLEKFDGEEPPYNPELAHAPSQELGLKWIDDWKKISGTKLSCMYEYRLLLDHYYDLGYTKVAKEIHRDMITIKNMGLNGNMSDQTARCFLPTGLPMCIMGETLFDTDLNFNEYVFNYYNAAFGEDGEKCRHYLETLSELFMPDLLRNCKGEITLDDGFVGDDVYKKMLFNNPYAAQNFEKIPGVVEDFMPVINKNRNIKDICHKKSWDYLKYHAHIVTELSKVYLDFSCGNKQKSEETYLKLIDWISIHELEIAPVFDLFLFNASIARKIAVNNREPQDGLA